ncbi:MAG TPA: nuclear transport factor 2 family protein [Kofleriaceae bacterium]|nr:nuclear transport factor 2 family protein [Kofleriaceae bacterium]
MALVADPVYVLGPRKKDALATRADALVTLREILDAEKDKKFPVKSGNLSVVASQGGLSAWAVDTIDVQGETMAVTVVLSNADDFWVVAAASVAVTPSMKSVRASLAKDAVVPPAMEAPGSVPDAAEAAADRFKRGFGDPTVWGDDLSKRGDAVVIGPAAEEITRGKTAIAKLWKKRTKANVRYASAGDTLAGTTPDGQIAWVSAPVVRFEDNEDQPLPLRLFGVYEKAGSDWKLISLQESLAIDEPGQGASFKKIAAPAVKQDEPPPKPKTEDKPKKKTKKKKKSSDD